ncbi:MAG: PDZ domain-containing protein [Planctomycetes bacterium]|nr:PDZ domain-containing protein [Planctomycetota bacterium]
MKRLKLSWDALLVMSIVIVAGVCSQTQQAALAKDEAGRVVQISPDADDAQVIEEKVVEEPTYWIGIRGRGVQSPVLRTQLQLAEDMGVVVEGVIKESPAKKAGLRKYDIILRANGDAVYGMEVLQQQVRENGEKPIELKLIRLGKEETIVVIPEELPQDFATSNANPRQEPRGRLGGGRPEALRQFMDQLQREGGMRFGPGAFWDNAQPNQMAMPNGVSISVTRKNGEPVRVTIRRGAEVWEIVGNDPKALEQLPDDLRPFAERALQQGQAGLLGGMTFDFDKGLEELLPRGLGGLRGGVLQGQDLSPQEKELSERLGQMEQELRELQKRLLEEEPVAADEIPAN